MTFTNNLAQFIQVLQNNGVVIFPTDTVWGIGCLVTDVLAIQKFYQIKKRESGKPTAILVGSLDQAKEYGIFTPKALSLTKVHWPGALTVIVKATTRVPQEILGPNGTVGLRFPDFDTVQKLTTQLRAGVIAGSANFAGDPPPMQKSELNPELMKLVDAVLDGECGGQPPSTVVDAAGDELKIIRQGSVVIGE